jgi:hypothetical protein
MCDRRVAVRAYERSTFTDWVCGFRGCMGFLAGLAGAFASRTDQDSSLLPETARLVKAAGDSLCVLYMRSIQMPLWSLRRTPSSQVPSHVLILRRCCKAVGTQIWLIVWSLASLPSTTRSPSVAQNKSASRREVLNKSRPSFVPYSCGPPRFWLKSPATKRSGWGSRYAVVSNLWPVL